MTLQRILASRRIWLFLLQQYYLVQFGAVALLGDRSTEEACRRERPLCASAADGTAIGPVDCAQSPIVFILAGQSNMDGQGLASELANLAPQIVPPLSAAYCVRAGFATGPLQPGYGFRDGFFGPELMLGHVLRRAFPESRPIVIFKEAHGDTTLHVNWTTPTAAARRGERISGLYTAMIRRLHTMLASLDQVVPGYDAACGYEIGAFVWFQGESDAVRLDRDGVLMAQHYRQNLRDLLHDVQADLGLARLRSVVVQINESPTWDTDAPGCSPRCGGPTVREAQATVVNELRERGEACELVVTAGLSPKYHYDTPSVLRIGILIADATRRLGVGVGASAGVDHQYSVASAAEVVWRRMAAQSARWSALLRSGAAGVSMMERRVLSLQFEEGEGVAVWADGVPRTRAPTGVFASAPDWIDGLHGKAVRMRTDYPRTPNELRVPLLPALPIAGLDGEGDALSVSLLVQSRLVEGRAIIGQYLRVPWRAPRSSWPTAGAGWLVATFLDDGSLGAALRLRDRVRAVSRRDPCRISVHIAAL